MPQPTPGQLHIDHYLTNLQVSWALPQDRFIAAKVFPMVPVQHASDSYAIYDKGYFYRDELAPRPLGDRPRQAGYAVTKGTYLCEEYALEHKIDDRVRANADQPLDPDEAGMRLLTTQALIHQDAQWATKYFTTGVWGSDQTGVGSSPSTNQFLQFDQSGSDPIGFIDTLRDNMGGTTGFPPNTLVLGVDAFRVLKNHPNVQDRIKYTQRGMVTPQLLAELLELDQVLIARGVQNTAKEGQTNAISYIVNRKAALLSYAAPAPSLDEPSAGYTFVWTGLIPGATNAMGGVIERGREELAHSDVLQVRTAFDIEPVATELGTFLASVVA